MVSLFVHDNVSHHRKIDLLPSNLVRSYLPVWLSRVIFDLQIKYQYGLEDLAHTLRAQHLRFTGVYRVRTARMS